MKMRLRDKFGRILGIVVKEGDIWVLEDRMGKKLATYNEAADETKDMFGRLIAKGNWLSAVLYRELRNKPF